MIVAKWQIDARFGHKQNVVDMLSAWARDIAPQIGWSGNGRLLTGSVGAREATVVHEWTVKNLAELDQAWAARPTTRRDRCAAEPASGRSRCGL